MMTKERQKALEYLAEVVGDYLSEGLPVVYLTGEARNGQPDPHHVKKLRAAFTALGPGFDHVVNFLP